MRRVLAGNGRLGIPSAIFKLFRDFSLAYVCKENETGRIYFTDHPPEYINIGGINCTDIILDIAEIRAEKRMCIPVSAREILGIEPDGTDVILEAQLHQTQDNNKYYKVYIRKV